MTINAIGGATATPQTSGIGAAKSAEKTAFDQILDAFKKEAAKTPAERARDAVLKKHGLTDDSYGALPSDQKKAIDAEIVQAAARAMGADKGNGQRTAISLAGLA